MNYKYFLIIEWILLDISWKRYVSYKKLMLCVLRAPWWLKLSSQRETGGIWGLDLWVVKQHLSFLSHTELQSNACLMHASKRYMKTAHCENVWNGSCSHKERMRVIPPLVYYNVSFLRPFTKGQSIKESNPIEEK